MLIFNDVIKSIELLSLTSGNVNEETTGAYKPGIHRSLIITDSNGQKWLVKLSAEEHISSWRKIPPNRCYVREVAASIISDAMKLGLVPETKLINYDDKLGSAQKWIEAKTFTTMEVFSEKDIWLSGIFDLLIGQLDRHKGNFLISNQNMPVLIDNGYSMPYDINDKSRNIIISRFAYEIWDKPIPPWLITMLTVTPWDKVKRELYDERLFGENAAAVDLFFKRLSFILENKKASIPDFMVTRRIIR